MWSITSSEVLHWAVLYSLSLLLWLFLQWPHLLLKITALKVTYPSHYTQMLCYPGVVYSNKQYYPLYGILKKILMIFPSHHSCLYCCLWTQTLIIYSTLLCEWRSITDSIQMSGLTCGQNENTSIVIYHYQYLTAIAFGRFSLKKWQCFEL